MKFINNRLKFNSSRYYLNKVNEEFAKNIPNDSLVLDAGAGEQPYRYLFKHAQYESADICILEKEYNNPTYNCDLKEIPVENDRFDFIIFNQVLEHVPDPLAVLQELNRVLKKGGKMIYTGPLFYEEHEQPFDFYRYTQFGLQELFKKSNFEINEINWMEGYFGTMGYQLNRMYSYMPNSNFFKGKGLKFKMLFPIVFLLKYIFAFASILFHKIDVQYKYTGKGYPKNYHCIVSKN